MVLGGKSIRKAKDKIQASMSQTVTLKLVHGRQIYETSLPCFSTFGQLKVRLNVLPAAPESRSYVDVIAGFTLCQIFVGTLLPGLSFCLQEYAHSVTGIPLQDVRLKQASPLNLIHIEQIILTRSLKV